MLERLPHQFTVIVVVGAACLCLGPCEYAFSQTTQPAARSAEAKPARLFIEESSKLIQNGNYARAIALLSAVIRKGDNSPQAYKLRGKAFDRIGNSGRAIKDFSRYIQLNPSDPEGYILRGDARTFSHDYEQALDDYNKALKLSPSSAEAYLGRGLAHAGMNRYKEAAKDYQWVLTKNPKNPEALINMGRACMLSGRPIEAMNYLERALETETNLKWRQTIQGWMDELLKGQQASKQQSRGPLGRPAESRPRKHW